MAESATSTIAATTTSTTATAPAASTACGQGPHRDAWLAVARTHAAITARLQEALTAAGLPPLPWFDVLATLSEAPEQRLKMGELAEALVITRGGLTKLVDRLIKAGLLERTFCETDRRVSYATLLPAGLELLEEMRPIVSGELEATFAANLSEEQARELAATLESVQGKACGAS